MRGNSGRGGGERRGGDDSTAFSSEHEGAARQTYTLESCLGKEEVLPRADELCLPVVSADRERAGGGVLNRRRLSRFSAVAASLVLIILVTLGLSGRQHFDSLAARGVWRENHDIWSVLENEGDSNAMPKPMSKMTRVGRRFQDNENIGMILAAAAHMASDTIVEIKRSLLGMQHEEHVAASNSKINVAETMLAHLMQVLGIQTIPEPSTTAKLASVKTAMRMAKDLRMVIADLPEKTDALNLHEAQYNLAVYDLIQISRQINEILMQISSDRTLDGIREPTRDRFDVVLKKAEDGLEDAEDAYGADKRQSAKWDTATKEAVYNFLPGWKQRLEDYEGIDATTSKQPESPASSASPDENVRSEDQAPDVESESQKPQKAGSAEDQDQGNGSTGDQLIKFAVAAAIKQARPIFFVALNSNDFNLSRLSGRSRKASMQEVIK
eukprot:761095-Hanusia_phi.AAC.3